MRGWYRAIHGLRSITRVPLIIAAALGAACEASDKVIPPIQTPVISPSQYALSVGDTLRIRATYSERPCDCLWASANEARASVDGSGLVRALAPGWVTVVATYRRNQNAKASALVEVVAP
jgi:hypothetical protein